MSSSAVHSERPAARGAPLVRVLVVDDDEADATLVLRALTAHGYQVSATRVEDELALGAALETDSFDLCISEYAMASFDAMAALAILQRLRPDLPVIVVSSSVTEVRAVNTMRAGAQDCISKHHLVRLGPAVDRGLDEAKKHRLHRETEEARRQLAAEARTSERRFQSLIAAMEDVSTFV